MYMEFEKKVLDIDVAATRKKLKAIGCKKIHGAKMFKRNVFYMCDKEVNGFARVRDEGTHVTLTTKLMKDPKYPEEIDITVNADFDTATKLVANTGLEQKSFQESIREKYSHPLAHEITIDIIPGLPTYMEIDCTSEENLDKLIRLLEIDTDKLRTGSYDKQFQEYYDITKTEFMQLKTLTFRGIKKEIKPKKNQTLFHKVIRQYTESYLKQTEKPLKLTTIKRKRCKNGTRKKCVST